MHFLPGPGTLYRCCPIPFKQWPAAFEELKWPNEFHAGANRAKAGRGGQQEGPVGEGVQVWGAKFEPCNMFKGERRKPTPRSCL